MVLHPCLAALAGRLADGAAAGLLEDVARFKKRSITIKQHGMYYSNQREA